jgi:hypothetical protein
MYQQKVFAQGIKRVLCAEWKLRCETPLVIRNGLSVAYTEPKGSTSPDVHLHWRPPTTDTHSVASLYYGYEIVNGHVSAFHVVPASTVRGALRSWTIQHVVHADFRDVGTLPPTAEPEQAAIHAAKLRQALADKRYGYPLIASLFGLALDTARDDEQMSNASRLRIATEKFDQVQLQPLSASGMTEQGDGGPSGADRFMNVRNPLDRITHASKVGGLHHFLEFCAQQSFIVRLTILNPQAADLGLLSLWVNEMNHGLLRIGGLTSIGRGRVAVIAQSYDLWRSRHAPPLAEIEHLLVERSDISGDALAGLWHHFEVPPLALSHCESALQAYIGGNDAHP